MKYIGGKFMQHKRWLSLDALRGFDMIWILGLDGFLIALAKALPWAGFLAISAQMKHATWHGFNFYDLIFPLFIFVSGATLGLSERPFQILSSLEKRSRYKKATTRLLVLCLLGVLYNHGWGVGLPVTVQEIRFSSVLQRIGIAWFFTAMIVWHFSLKTQYLIAGLLVFTYGFCQVANPVLGAEAMNFTLEGSFNTYVDSGWRFGASYRDQALDPEGPFAHLAATVNGLMGYWSIHQLKNKNEGAPFRIAFSALCLMCAAYLAHPVYPINKTLWTLPFVMVTSGWSMMLLLIFHLIVDRGHFNQVIRPLLWVGTNAILIYMLTSLVSWRYTVESVMGEGLNALSPPWRLTVLMLLIVLVQLFFLRALFNKKWFLKV